MGDGSVGRKKSPPRCEPPRGEANGFKLQTQPSNTVVTAITDDQDGARSPSGVEGSNSDIQGVQNSNMDSHETIGPQNLNLKLTHFLTTLFHIDSIPVEDEVDTAKDSEAMIIVALVEVENWVNVLVDYASEKFMHLRSINLGQDEQISPPGFEGLEICFKVGCGNVQGNKNTSKGRLKRSGNKDKSVSQSLHSPKEVKPMEKSTIGSPKVMRNWKTSYSY